MAVDEQVDEIIAQAAFNQMVLFRKEVKLTVTEIAELSKAAKSAFDDLGAAKTIAELAKSSKAVAETNKAIGDTVTTYKKATTGIKELTAAQVEANIATKARNDMLKLQAAAEALPAGSISKTRAEAALLRKELSLLNVEQEKERQDFIRGEIDKKDAFIKANVDSYTAQKINIGNYPEAIAQINVLKNEMDALAASGQKDSAEFAQLDAKLKQVQASLGPTQVQMRSVTTSMEQLFVAGKQDSAEFQDLAKQAASLQAQLQAVKSAISGVTSETTAELSAFDHLNNQYREATAAVNDYAAKIVVLQREIAMGVNVDENGQHLLTMARNLKAAQDQVQGLNASLVKVGEIAKVSDPNVRKFNSSTFAMTQILREAPSFAYSTATGLLGISNNIPILIDEIEKLNAANKSLVAEGKPPVSVLKNLGAAIFSVNGMITIGVAAITIFAARMASGTAGMTEAEKEAKKLTDTIADLGRTMKAAFDEEIEKSKNLFDVAADVGLSYTTRYEAVSKLLQLYPELLANLDREAFLTGRVADEQNVISSVIAKQNQAETLRKNIELLGKQRDELQKQIEEEGKASAYFGFYNPLSDEHDPEKAKAVTKMNADLKDTKELLAIVNKELGYMLNPQHKGRILSDIDNDIKDQERIRDTSEAADAVHLQAIARLKELEKERKDYMGKEKKEKDTSLKNEQDYTREVYDEYSKRLLLLAEVQRAISEDETKSLEERLTAYREYSELTLDAETVKSVGALEILNNSLADIARIEKISAGDRTQQQKDLLAKKQVLLQQHDNIAADYALKEQQHIDKTAKGIVSIQDNEVKKRIDSLKDLTANVEIQERAALEVLNNSLTAGTISYEQYTRERKLLEDGFQKEKFRQIRDYLQLEIDALSKQGVDVSDLQRLLNKDLADLYDADFKTVEDKAKQKAGLQKRIQSELTDLSAAGIDFVSSMADSAYEKQMQQQQALLSMIQKKRDEEVKAIQDSTQSEKQKNTQINALNAQTAAQEKAIQAEMSRIKRQQAIADKAAAIAQATQAGIVAAVSALKYDPTGTLSAIIGVIAGIQIAKIALMPIPAYAKGTKNHRGGLALVGEERPETIIEPGKDPYNVYEPSILPLAKGTQVIPRAIPEKDLLQMSLAGIRSPFYPGMQMPSMNVDLSKLESTFKQEGKATRQAIVNMPQTQFTARNGEITKVVVKATGKSTFIDSKTN